MCAFVLATMAINLKKEWIIGLRSKVLHCRRKVKYQVIRAGVTNLFVFAGHFVSYHWGSGSHNFLVILWNLLKTKKKFHQQKQTTKKVQVCWSRLNALRATQNSFAGRMRPAGLMFVTPELEGKEAI